MSTIKRTLTLKKESVRPQLTLPFLIYFLTFLGNMIEPKDVVDNSSSSLCTLPRIDTRLICAIYRTKPLPKSFEDHLVILWSILCDVWLSIT